MTSYPLPPPPPASPPPVPAAKAPSLGWGAAVAGVLGLLALILPWYQPHVSAPLNRDVGSSYHAWSGLFILIVGPLLLLVMGALWVQGMLGQTNSRFANSDNPARSLSLQSMIAGGVAIVAGLVSIPLVTNHYKDWDAAARAAKALGATLNRGPQLGLWLLFAGGVIMLVVGVLGFLAANKSGAVGADGPEAGSFGPPGFPPPAAPGQPGSPLHTGSSAPAPSYPPPSATPAPGFEPPAPPSSPNPPVNPPADSSS